MSDFSHLMTPLEELIREAGNAILDVYNATQEIEVDTKDDNSPVTQADLAAHHCIARGLARLTPDIPLLSEEGGMPEYEERSSWDTYWLVDPLDGTKEFINRNGEFTVNIALIRKGEPILGLVYVPVQDLLYAGYESTGAYKISSGVKEAIESKPLVLNGKLNVVGSRRHGAEALDAMLKHVEPSFEQISRVDMGSSLKICACADGSADWYPRLALTSEWDTAAAHAVLRFAGGEIYTPELKPLRYNTKADILNPYFHAVGDAQFEWSQFINS